AFKERSASPARRLMVAFAAFAAIMLLVTSASAIKFHSFKEVFGSVAQPSFGEATGMTVDPSGDLLVMDTDPDTEASTISRFNSDGTPDVFAALGTNVIDGKGTGDATPQDGLSFGGAIGSSQSQIALDDSGGPTDGDIYVTQTSPPLVNVFSEDGEYLGQL